MVKEAQQRGIWKRKTGRFKEAFQKEVALELNLTQRISTDIGESGKQPRRNM